MSVAARGGGGVAASLRAKSVWWGRRAVRSDGAGRVNGREEGRPSAREVSVKARLSGQLLAVSGALEGRTDVEEARGSVLSSRLQAVVCRRR